MRMHIGLALIAFVSSALGATEDLDSLLSHPKYLSAPLGRSLKDRYIIEFADDYTGSSLEFLDALQTDIQQIDPALTPSRVRMSIYNEFGSSSIFRGVSIHMRDTLAPSVEAASSTQRQILHHILGEHHVKQVFPVTEIPRPSIHDALNLASPLFIEKMADGQQLPFSHNMTQVDRVHRELGLKGKDIIVGIIDTGVDYNHPALGGGFGPGYRIRYGQDLVGNDFNFTDPTTIHHKETPLDTCGSGGHGTHVTGIIGADDSKYNFTGVAPEATLGMWRIFGCVGSTTNDLVIKALLLAYDAGCHVINLSLGSPSNWAYEPSSVVADRIASKGVSVIVAAGNEGDQGPFLIAAPSTGRRAVSVASIDNAFTLQRTFLTESGDRVPYTLSSSTTTFPNGSLALYDANGNDLGCGPASKRLDGKIALIMRGQCSFDDKAVNAAKAGAIGAVVYDSNNEDPFQPETTQAPIPLIAITRAASENLLKLISESGEKETPLMFYEGLTAEPVSTAGRVSKFSSLGPTNELALKPNLAGIGGYVFSTLPQSQGGYGILSGTSMAAPYVAGSFALYLQQYPNTDPVFASEQFQNHAKPVPVNGRIDNPIRQGAGLLQVYDTIQSTMHVSPGQLSFNDTVRQQSQTVTITNTGSSAVTYSLYNIYGAAAAPFNASQSDKFSSVVQSMVYTRANVTAKLDFSVTTLTIEPQATATVLVRVAGTQGSDSEEPYPVYGGFVQLSSPHRPSIQIPYIGVVGNVTQLPIFAEGFPTLTNKSLGTSQEANAVANSISAGAHMHDEKNSKDIYVIDRSDANLSTVSILFRLQSGTMHLRTEVLDSQYKPIGTLSEQNFLPRNTLSGLATVSIDSWNATMLVEGFNDVSNAIPVDDGTYYLRWKALKWMADPQFLSSWETVLSDPILVR